MAKSLNHFSTQFGDQLPKNLFLVYIFPLLHEIKTNDLKFKSLVQGTPTISKPCGSGVFWDSAHQKSPDLSTVKASDILSRPIVFLSALLSCLNEYIFKIIENTIIHN